LTEVIGPWALTQLLEGLFCLKFSAETRLKSESFEPLIGFLPFLVQNYSVKPTPPMMSPTKNLKPKTSQFLLNVTRRLVTCFEGLNSCQAQLAGELQSSDSCRISKYKYSIHWLSRCCKISPNFKFVCFYRVDPFSKKDWYDVKAPAMFKNRQIGKTLVSRTVGTKIAADGLKGRVFECNQVKFIFDSINISIYIYRRVHMLLVLVVR